MPITSHSLRPEFAKLFDVIVHTNDILVIQTHSSDYIDGCLDSHLDSCLDSYLDSHLDNVMRDERGKPQDDKVKKLGENASKTKTIDSNSTNNKDIRNDNKNETFGQFNLGMHVNDAPKKVLLNRACLLSSMNQYLASSNGLRANQSGNKSNARFNSSSALVESIHWINQIHSNDVYRIGGQLNADASQTVISLDPPSADALISDKTKTALAIMTADCVPIVIYDESIGQLAAVHAGWQGLAKGIIATTCNEMRHHNKVTEASNLDNSSNSSSNGSTEQPMQAWIGSCISQSCYEVSRDVIDKLLAGCEKIGLDRASVEQRIVATHKNPDKAWLDLPALAALQLQANGVLVNTYSDVQANTSKCTGSNSHLNNRQGHNNHYKLPSSIQSKVSSHVSEQVAFACSYRDSRYYSYRRMTHLGNKNTGRMAMVAVRLK